MPQKIIVLEDAKQLEKNTMRYVAKPFWEKMEDLNALLMMDKLRWTLYMVQMSTKLDMLAGHMDNVQETRQVQNLEKKLIKDINVLKDAIQPEMSMVQNVALLRKNLVTKPLYVQLMMEK